MCFLCQVWISPRSLFVAQASACFILATRLFVGCNSLLSPHQTRYNSIVMYAPYVLRSLKDKQFYLGSTDNLRRRIKEHNSGKVFSTKNRVPFELIYCELYKSEADARRREKNLKLRSKAFAQLKKRIINKFRINVWCGDEPTALQVVY